MPLRLTTSFREHLASTERALVGMWACSGSSLVTEICAGSGLDWLLIDMEHAPNTLESVLMQLQTAAAYPITPVVRVPSNDPTTIKQVLDLGAQTILVPMVSTAAQAQAAVEAVHYPPRGRRGVGSSLARSSRWNRVEGYLAQAESAVTLIVQIETAEGAANAQKIIETEGIDAVFAGPADLAASMGLLGQQAHPDVLIEVQRVIAAAKAAGTPVGVNAFDPAVADDYIAGGIDFISVGADVALLARSSEALASHFVGEDAAGRASY